MQEDRQGNVWLGVDNTLWRFTRATTEWVNIAPTEPVSPNIITALAFNEAGEPWLTMLTCDTSRRCTESTLYHVQNGVWIPIIRLNSDSWFSGILIDSDDRVWTTTRDGIYQIVDNHPILVSHLVASALTMDSTGRIWAVGRDSSSANNKLSLWVVNP